MCPQIEYGTQSVSIDDRTTKVDNRPRLKTWTIIKVTQSVVSKSGLTVQFFFCIFKIILKLRKLSQLFYVVKPCCIGCPGFITQRPKQKRETIVERKTNGLDINKKSKTRFENAEKLIKIPKTNLSMYPHLWISKLLIPVRPRSRSGCRSTDLGGES